MTRKQRKLTARERLFCALEAERMNAVQSAACAGYACAERAAFQLLEREEIRAEIRRRRKAAGDGNEEAALAGLRRVAFGDVGDAMQLLTGMGDLTPEKLARLDLFAVSEIRMGKDGACTVRFHDRTRALALLLDYRRGAEEGTSSLMEALDRGARAVEALPDDDAL